MDAEHDIRGNEENTEKPGERHQGRIRMHPVNARACGLGVRARPTTSKTLVDKRGSEVMRRCVAMQCVTITPLMHELPA